jgi:hypothetical protein
MTARSALVFLLGNGLARCEGGKRNVRRAARVSLSFPV